MSKENSDFLIAANLAHEIQNPVQAILGLCEMGIIEKETLGSDQVLQKIKSCAEELSELVKDVLEFSQYQQAPLPLKKESFDLVGAFHETLSSHYPKARSKGIELIGFTPADAPEQVLGDKIKFKRILHNLLQNAVKFTPEGLIHASLNLQKSPSGYPIEIKVQDTGIGIPQERLDSIFQPFVQAEASTMERFGGTGLGLTIVKALAQAMGGDVQVKSEVGKGTCFTVKLDCAMIDSASITAPSLLKKKRVLLQGGSPHLQSWLSQSLQLWGAEVIGVNSPLEAENLIQEEKFDYLIIDIPQDTSPQLPKLDSITTILLTDFDYSFQGYRVVPKPVNLQNLRKHFENQKTQSESSPQILPQKVELPLRILMAEDNEVNREVISRQLKRAGYEVSATVDGIAALELWRAKEFDIVILDLHMPLMGGIEVANFIRKEEKRLKRKPVPLVALTGTIEPGQRTESKRAGFDTYLVKPLRGADLVEKMRIISQVNQSTEEIDEFTKNLQLADEQEAEDLKCAGRVFLKYSQSFIEKLQTALNNNDPKDIRFQAHAVCGMLGMMGCSELVRLAGQIDRKPRDPQTVKRVKQLIDGLRRLQESLRSLGDLTADGQT